MRAVWSRSDNPEEAQAARQSMLRLSSSWLSPGYMHSGSDGDDDTSSIGGWSDATFDACSASGGKSALRAPSSAHWHDRGMALSAALQNCAGMATDPEPSPLEASRQKPGVPARTSLPEVSSNYTERLKALTQSVLAARSGGHSEDSLPNPSVAPRDKRAAESSETTDETAPAGDRQGVEVVRQETKRSLYVDVGSPDKRRDVCRALVDPGNVRGLGDVISPVYRMAECFAEMKWARDGQPESEQPGSTHASDGKGDSPETRRDQASAAECVEDPATQGTSGVQATPSFTLLENDIMVTSPVDDILGTEFWESMVTQDLMYLPDASQQATPAGVLRAPDGDAHGLQQPLTNVAIMLSQSEHASPSYVSNPEEISRSMEDASNWLHTESVDGLCPGGPRVASALLTSHPLSDEELSSPARTIRGPQEGSPETRSSAEAVSMAPISPLQDLVSSPGLGTIQQISSPLQGAMTTPRRHRSHIAEAMMVTCGLHSPISFDGSPAGSAPGARTLFSPEMGKGRLGTSPLASPYLQRAPHSPACPDKAALGGNSHPLGQAVPKPVFVDCNSTGAPLQGLQAGQHGPAPPDVPCSTGSTDTTPLASHDEQETGPECKPTAARDSLTAPPETSPRSAGLMAVSALCSVRAPAQGLDQTVKVSQILDSPPLPLSAIPRPAPSTVSVGDSVPHKACTVAGSELSNESQSSIGPLPAALSPSGTVVPDGEKVPQKSLAIATGQGVEQLGEGPTPVPSHLGGKERDIGLPTQTDTQTGPGGPYPGPALLSRPVDAQLQHSSAADGEEAPEDLVPDRSDAVPTAGADPKGPAEALLGNPPCVDAPIGTQTSSTTATAQSCTTKPADAEAGLKTASAVRHADPEKPWTQGALVEPDLRPAQIPEQLPASPVAQPAAAQVYRAEGPEHTEGHAHSCQPGSCTGQSISGSDLADAKGLFPQPVSVKQQPAASAESMPGEASLETGTHALPAKHSSGPSLSEAPAAFKSLEMEDATMSSGSDANVEFPAAEKRPLLPDENAQLPAPVSHVLLGKVGGDGLANIPNSDFTQGLATQNGDLFRSAAHTLPQEHMVCEPQGTADARNKENAANVQSSPTQRPVLAPICNTAGTLPKSPARKPAVKKPSIHSPAKSAPAVVQGSSDPASPVIQHKSQRAMAIESLLKRSNLDLYHQGSKPSRQAGSSSTTVEPRWDYHVPNDKPSLPDAACEDADQKDPSRAKHAPASEIAGDESHGTGWQEEHLSMRLIPSAPITFPSPGYPIMSSSRPDGVSVADPQAQPDALLRAGGAPLRLPAKQSTLQHASDQSSVLPHGRASSADGLALNRMVLPAEIQSDVPQDPPAGGNALQRHAGPVQKAPEKVVVPKIVGLQATPADKVQKPRSLSLFRRTPRGERSPALRRKRLSPAFFWGTKKPVVPADGFVYVNVSPTSKERVEGAEARPSAVPARKDSFLARWVLCCPPDGSFVRRELLASTVLAQ